MSRTTKIPRSAARAAYVTAAATAAAVLALVVTGPIRGVGIAAILAGLGVGLAVARQRMSRVTSVSFSDIPIVLGILLLDPALATLIGLLVGVIPPGRLGKLSRAINLCMFALPAAAAAGAFRLLQGALDAGSPTGSPMGWFGAAAIAVLVNVFLHGLLASMWTRLAWGYRVLDAIRDMFLPVAKYDLLSGLLMVPLVELGLLVSGVERLLPVSVAVVGVVGLGLFLAATRRQSEARELKDDFFRAIFVSLARLLEMKDPETALHSARVAIYSRDIALMMGLDDEEQSRIHLAGLLHDVGKVGVPDEILLKPGRLTDDERRIMQRHARLSAEALVGIPGFGDLVRMIYAHHERLDGSGYPEGIRGDELTVGARILGVADTFEALTSDRPYRPGRSAAEAMEVIHRDARLFDPSVVQALQALVDSGSTDYTFGRMADFSHEWSYAARYLDVRLDEEEFVLPPERLDDSGPTLAVTDAVPDLRVEVTADFGA